MVEPETVQQRGMPVVVVHHVGDSPMAPLVSFTVDMTTLEAAAGNTSDTKLIGETAAGVEAVLNEGLNHHLFLGRVLEKVRS